MDEILWCDHAKETSTAVLLHGIICVLTFYKMIFFFLNLDFFFLYLNLTRHFITLSTSTIVTVRVPSASADVVLSCCAF